MYYNISGTPEKPQNIFIIYLVFGPIGFRNNYIICFDIAFYCIVPMGWILLYFSHLRY